MESSELVESGFHGTSLKGYSYVVRDGLTEMTNSPGAQCAYIERIAVGALGD